MASLFQTIYNAKKAAANNTQQNKTDVSNQQCINTEFDKHLVIKKLAELYNAAKNGAETYNEESAKVLYKKCKNIFKELGVTILDTQWFKNYNNLQFDERYADAVEVVNSMFPEFDNTINVLEDGFMDTYSGDVIVYAKVSVLQYFKEN